MSARTSTPRLVDAVMRVLQAELPALAAEQGLPAVLQWLKHQPGLIAPAAAPQVWVTVRAARPGGPAEFGGSNAHWTRVREVAIGVTSAGEEADEADARLQAYADLIAAVMDGNQTMRGEAYRVRWLGTAYTDNLAQSMALFREAVVRVECACWGVQGED